MKLLERMTLTAIGLKMCAELDHRIRKVNETHSQFQLRVTLTHQPFIFSVLPRLMFDQFSETEYSHVLSYDHARDVIAELIVQVCKKYKFDGIVLEVYFQLAGRVQDKHLLKLVEHLGKDRTPKVVSLVS